MDLVLRLRYEADEARKNWPEVFCVSEDTAEEAADEIQRLQTKNEELKKALDLLMNHCKMIRMPVVDDEFIIALQQAEKLLDAES